MAEHGYTKHLHREAPFGRSCICPEDFEHDGPCQNAIREKKSAKCTPCAHGWHFPYPCNKYISKGYKTVWTECATCGWDSAEHADVQASFRELTVDSRVRRSQHT